MSTQNGNGNQTAALTKEQQDQLAVINLSPEDITTINEASDKMDKIVTECGVVALRGKPPLMQAIQLARGVSGMRFILKEELVRKFFLPLMGTHLGFVTDMDKEDPSKHYPWTVVRDVMIEGLLRGFRPVNNEFNILAGRFYGAKSGYERIVREFPGLCDLQFDLGVPELKGDKGALVAFEARWYLDGEEQILRGTAPTKPEEFDTRIPVKVNSGMGPDAVLGKAERKMYARIYKKITGYAADDAEPESPLPADHLPSPAAPSQDGRRMRVGKQQAKPTVTTTGETTEGERQPGQEG